MKENQDKDKNPTQNEPSVPMEPATIDTESMYPDLRGIRKAKGLSLKDVYEETRITSTNLEAIEAGRFNALPEPVYTRMFIKNYTRYLEVDGAPVLKRYEAYLAFQHKPTGRPTEKRRDEQPVKKGKKKYLLGSFLALGLLVVIVAGIFFHGAESPDHVPFPPGVQKAPPNREAQHPSPLPPSMPKERMAVTTLSPSPPAGPSTPSTPPPGSADKDLMLSIAATEKTWLRITSDGGKAEELMLRKGEAIERTARKAFQITVGNAGGVQVRFQGKQLPDLGKRGEVKHLKLT